MRCNALRWLWGLIPLAIVWWLGLLAEHGRIEADLKARAQAELATANASWATASFSGRDATLTGSASEAETQKTAVDTVQRLWGVRQVDNRTTLADTPATYLWSAARNATGIELSGYIPSQAARGAVLANVRALFEGVPVDDRSRIAPGGGDAEQWLGGLKFALARLKDLKGGRVELADGSLTVEGEAADIARYRTLKTSLAGPLPAGLKLKLDGVTPATIKPYTWSASQKAGRVELTGHAPSERQRDNLVDLTRSVFPRGEVVSRMAVAAGEPRGWQAVAGAVMPLLGRMTEGKAELVDQTLRVSGIVDDRAKVEELQSALSRGMPAGITVTGAIDVDAAAIAAEQARRSRETDAKRQADAAAAAAAEAEAERQRAAAAARQKAAADEAARQKAAADEAARQEAARRLAAADQAARLKAEAEEAERRRVADDEAKRRAVEAAKPEVRAAVDRCQALLSKAVRQGTINFKRASADLDPVSHATLQELARIAIECPKVEIDIIGHTDNEGTPERNQRLSERRAQAVADYLADAGVQDARLHAVGFGESQPVAPNNSAENMARNRRIEFVVRTN